MCYQGVLFLFYSDLIKNFYPVFANYPDCFHKHLVAFVLMKKKILIKAPPEINLSLFI